MTTNLTANAEIQHTSLTKTDQKRLERLAASAGRTPQAMLRFVLREGFTACEEDVVESNIGDNEFVTGKSASHESVMQAAKKRIKDVSKRV